MVSPYFLSPYFPPIFVDKRGNPVRTIVHIPDAKFPEDASKVSYMITLAEYDSRGNLVSTSVAFTVSAAELAQAGTDQYDYIPDSLTWQGRDVYNGNDHRTSVITGNYGDTIPISVSLCSF